MSQSLSRPKGSRLEHGGNDERGRRCDTYFGLLIGVIEAENCNHHLGGWSPLEVKMLQRPCPSAPVP